MFTRQNSLPCIFQKIRCASFRPVHSQKKNLIAIINTDQIFHIYYRTSCTDYSILILSPIPPQKFSPQPAEAEQRLQQTADTKSLFTFSRTSCFCSRDRKITRIDWLIFCTKFERANQNWRFGAMWRFKTAHHEDLKATREKRHDSCCHTRNFVHFHFLFCHI